MAFLFSWSNATTQICLLFFLFVFQEWAQCRVWDALEFEEEHESSMTSSLQATGDFDEKASKTILPLGRIFLSYSYSWGHILLIPYWYHIYEIKLILIKLNIHMCIFMKYIHDKTYIWNIIQGSDQATGQEQWSSLLAASLVQLLGMVVLVLWGVSLQNRPQTNQTQSRKKFHQCQRSCLLRFRGVLAKCLRSFLGSRSWMKTKWDCHLAFNFKYFFCSSMI